jgi:hypothetical protein
MENLNDTAARREENDLYLIDPTHPRAKPYSRKQKEAIKVVRGRTFLYHTEMPNGRIFEGHEIDDALEAGWTDTMPNHPNCPVKTVIPATKLEAKKSDPELDALWDEVERLNITPKPHHLSGKAKLMKAIADG